MKSLAIPFITLMLATGLWSCQKDAVSKIPQISLKGLSKDAMRADVDSLLVTFFISDGDGDIDQDPKGVAGVYVKDLRFDSSAFNPYAFPKTMRSSMKSTDVSGECYVIISGVSMRSDTTHFNSDTVKYEIYVKDLAGHESNHIFTPGVVVHK